MTSSGFSETGHRVLVTGATGFVGSRVATAMEAEGHKVRAMTRHPDDYEGAGEPVAGDVSDPESLGAALDGIEVAFYLVHSLDGDDFRERDAAGARAFGAAAKQAGVEQIVYLGGLGDDDEDELSEHLKSRREVERLLGEAGVPVTVLRAAVIVGDGGISWEMTRQLVQRLPLMIVPAGARTRTQPIAIDDVIGYLCGVAGHPDARGRVFEIGGPERLTYVQMLRQASRALRGWTAPIIPIPVLTPRLASHWISVITSVDTRTAGTLVDSMETEVVVRDHSIDEVVPRCPRDYRSSVHEALAERHRRLAGDSTD